MLDMEDLFMQDKCCKCRHQLTPDSSWYGLHLECFAQWFGLSEIAEFSDLVIRSQSQIPQDNQGISFFHGAYRKYSASLGKCGYILKVQQAEFPELPVTEFVCNQIFESLKISIPPNFLLRYPDDDLCFVTKNFMSGLTASNLVHVYHYIKDGMQYDCEHLVQIIGEQTSRRIEQERFVCLTLADSLIGNHDRHGRNLGFIRSVGRTVLAPFYDNPSAIGVEDHRLLGADLRPRGAIFTKDTDKPTMRDYVVEWERLGFGDTVELFRESYSYEQINGIISNSHMSSKRQNALLQLIQKRGQELCEA